MLMSNYIEELFELKGAILENIKSTEESLNIFISMKKEPHTCPCCSFPTERVHDYRTQIIKDVPFLHKATFIHLRKRRYVCPHCGKRFFEKIPFLPKYQRTTNRLWAFILSRFTEVSSLKSIAKLTSLSQATIGRILDKIDYGLPSLPKVIAFDEFKGNANGEKFQFILTNPKAKKVLDILPSRKADYLYSYFSKFKDRNNVQYVVIDMSTAFKAVSKHCFPNAKIIADKYHVIRQVTWAFERTRKKVQQNFEPSRRKYFKRSRTLLLKSQDKLKDYEWQQVLNMLSLSKELSQAYYLKNEFYSLMKEKDSYKFTKRMNNWIMMAQSFECKEFNNCCKTFIDWFDEIRNGIITGYTNGYTEGCNNKIKVIKRVSYGVRNFKRFRARIMHSLT